MKTLVILFLAFFTTSSEEQDISGKELTGTSTSFNSGAEELIDVSMINLIATPEKYHDKKIRVIGYLNLEFEGNAIYLHKEDFDRSILRNAFWVDFSEKIAQTQRHQCSRKYVLIEGTFDMKSHGHMGLFSGTINAITRLDIWTGRNER
jgi:hypothetical protein